MLRAQISTYEQALLFINSVSHLGMRWEYLPDRHTFSKKIKTNKLITKYHLIKNLPGDHFYGIGFKKYYPKIKYESSEQIL